MKTALKSLLLCLPLLLLGCGESETQAPKQAVAIESGEECHLCGMIITNFPGPKGELFDKQSPNAHKFCSTRDLFSYYLQPENQRQATQIYVHDMAKSAWDQPDDNHFTDARSAWYVAGSSQRGAMGPTLASFASQADAEAFAQEFGGRLLRFDEINFELLANL